MTNSNSSGQIDFMHWLIRLIAFIIDSIIIAIPTAIVYFIIIFASPGFFIFGGFLVIPLILGILEVLYYVILDVSWGATIGKRIMGLHVQMVNGGKVPFDKALIRNISKIYWIFLVLDWLIAIVTPGADRRQKYSDRIAGTTVIQVKQAFISDAPSTPSSPPPSTPPT
jgi:uncharacterized RDD family membrane protein YckC